MAPGTILAGRYRLERIIGSGGFGTVFEAVNMGSNERVALKILSPRVLEMAGGAERFRREADLARRLSHPNIVRVVDAGSDPNGALFIGFELLQGRSLQEEMAMRGAIAPRRAVAICCEVLSALEHAHGHGVVHRDLKPANVFLLSGAQEGVVKVLDFGIAKSTNPGTRPGLTQDGTALGTPAYMAPEQLSGGEIRPGTDVFSVGVVLAEMLVGRPLFDESQSAIQIITARLTRGLPIPEAILRSPLGEVVGYATATDPNQRFVDARQMRTALERVLPALPSEAFATGPLGAAGPTALGGAPTAASISATSQSPSWDARQAPGPMAYAPQHMPAPQVVPPAPKKGGGAAVLFIGALLLAACVAGGVAWMVVRPDAKRGARAQQADDDDQPRKKKKRAAPDEEEDEETDEGTPHQPPDEPRPRPPQPPPDPAPDPPPAIVGRASACTGVPAAPPGLRASLGQAGFKVTGQLVYCAGDMINFVCQGPRGDGFTVEGGNAAILKLDSPAAAEAFAKKEAREAQDETTYVWDQARVLRIEMKAADADRLLGKICRSSKP
jgi:hypothetical protein